MRGLQIDAFWRRERNGRKARCGGGEGGGINTCRQSVKKKMEQTQQGRHPENHCSRHGALLKNAGAISKKNGPGPGAGAAFPVSDAFLEGELSSRAV